MTQVALLSEEATDLAAEHTGCANDQIHGKPRFRVRFMADVSEDIDPHT
jgi:hypothetical protein